MSVLGDGGDHPDFSMTCPSAELGRALPPSLPWLASVQNPVRPSLACNLYLNRRSRRKRRIQNSGRFQPVSVTGPRRRRRRRLWLVHPPNSAGLFPLRCLGCLLFKNPGRSRFVCTGKDEPGDTVSERDLMEKASHSLPMPLCKGCLFALPDLRFRIEQKATKVTKNSENGES